MNLTKLIWGAIGGGSSACLMSFIYLFTSHSALVEIKDDMKSIQHVFKHFEKAINLDEMKKKHTK